MFLQYMKDRIWKPVLCALMAAALSICMFQGFNLDEHAISDSLPLTSLLALVMELLMTVFSYNRRSIIAGVAVMTGAAAVFFITLMAGNVTIRDELSSPSVIYIYVIVLYLASIAVYLLGSSRIGTAVLFALGVYLIAGLKYLEFESRPLYLILFAAAAIVEFAFLEYNKSALESVMYRPDFTRFGISSSAMAAAALGIAAVMFFTIIVPIHPGARDIRLLTQHIAIENLKVTGIMDQYPVEDPDLTTDRKDESRQEEKTEDASAGAEALAGDSRASGNDAGSGEENSGGSADQGNGQEEGGAAVSYQRHINKPLLVLISTLIAVVLAISLKLLQRRLWMRKVREKTPSEQVRLLYLGLLKKFHRLGFGRRPEDTPSAYAARNKRQMKVFIPEKTDFTYLTGIFLRVRYGQFEAEQKDCEAFYKIYDDFYKNCRTYTGKLKYLKQFFFL